MAGSRSFDRTALSPTLRGTGLSLLMFAGLAVYEWANGHRDGFHDLLISDSRPRTTTILVILSGFVHGAYLHTKSALAREIAELHPKLSVRAEPLESMFARYPFRPSRGARLATALGAIFGLLVIRRGGIAPAIFSDVAIDHHLVAGLAVNAILFGLMGRSVLSSIASKRLIDALAPAMPTIDLFDVRNFTPFARHGLRGAFLWLGGSSIASLLFIDQGHDAVTALIIAATVCLGAYSLLGPLRGVHKLISQAKQDELERVRDAMRSVRQNLLDTTSHAGLNASQHIPGLLAYEARVSAVREWPVDLSTIARFALLVAIAVGSWLGGAVVELLLDSALSR